jgi:hypothetical protein
MPCHDSYIRRQRFRKLLGIFALLLTGCASPGATLHVKPRHDAGIQYAPGEISGIMEILGYRQLPVVDPDTRQPVLVATDDSEYRLLFQHKENTSIRVDVHIIIGNGNIGLHLYQPDSEILDATAKQQYELLRQRLVLQYGAEHVSDRHPLLAP